MGNCISVQTLNTNMDNNIITISDLVTLNMIIIQRYYDNYNFIISWNKFISEKPMFSNFLYCTDDLRICTIRNDESYYRVYKTPLHTYCKIQNYTSKCRIVLSYSQKNTYDAFVKTVKYTSK